MISLKIKFEKLNSKTMWKILRVHKKLMHEFRETIIMQNNKNHSIYMLEQY